MKSKKLIITILVMLLASVCFSAGGTYPIRHRNVANPKLLTRLLQDRIGTLDDEVSDLEALSGGVFDNIGTGDIFYVDSGVAADLAGTTWATAFDTLQEGINACAANNGDIVYVAQGHAEDITNASLLDADNAGITIVGIGNGADMPEISFIDDTTAELTISAADVCIYNIRFLSNKADVATAIQIADAGDGAMILGCEFRETTVSTELLKMINTATNADELIIVGNRFIGGASADPTNAIYLGGGSDNSIIQGNHFYGTWSASVIDGLQGASTGLMIIDNTIVNIDATAGMTIQVESTSTGTISGNKCYGNAASFAIAGAKMFVAPDNIAMNTEVVTRTFEQMMGPFTGATSGLQGTTIHADMVLAQTDLDAILQDFLDYQLDTVAGVSTAVDADGNLEAHVLDKTVLSHIMTLDADTSTYRASTMSLEALDDDLDTIITTTGTTLVNAVAGIASTIAAMDDNGYAAVCEVNAGGDTHVICATLGGFGNDYFNTGWSLIVIKNNSSVGTAPEGDIIDIIDYDTAGDFTLSRSSTTEAITVNDMIMLKRTEELELDTPTILGSAGAIWYLNSEAAGDDTGKTWETASLTLTAVEALMAAGDTCYIAGEHDEEIGSVVLNLANTSFIGMGEGDGRPLFTVLNNGDEITVDAAGITIKNIRMEPSETVVAQGILVEDAGIGCTLENISFIEGETGNDEFVICIDLHASAAQLTVKDCTYYNLGATTAQTSCFIDLTAGTIDETTITGCNLFGEFANGAIYSNQACTNLSIIDNVISNTTANKYAIQLSGAATGVLVNNRLFSDSTTAYGMLLDPGSLKCTGNIGTDGIDEQGIAIPVSAETSAIAEEDDGSNLERLEYLQNKVEDILAGIRMAGGSVGDVYYCDDGGSASGDATTWATAETQLDDAYGKASASVGDIIFVAPAHSETIGAAAITLDVIGVTIIGIGDGADQPQIVMTNDASIITVSAADNTIKNINFHSTTDESAICIDVGAAGFIIEDCLFTDTGNFEHTICIDLDANAEEAEIRRCRFETHSTADAATACINQHTGVVNRLIIEDCTIFGTYSAAAILSTQANTNCLIQNNSITNNSTGVHCIELTAAMTGELVNNRLSGDKLNGILDPGSMRCFNNYASTGIDTSATLIPPTTGEVPEDGPGQVFYCDVGTPGAGDGKSWGTAVASLDAAINLCTTSRGDTIYVAAGHSETITGATGAAMDLIGVKVIGLGIGALRPTITFTTNIGATIAVTAADCTIENMILYSNFATGITAAITAGGSADGLTVDNVEFRDAGNTTEMFAHISLAQACDDVTIKNCYFSNTAASADTSSAILLVNAIDNCRIMNNRFHLDAEDACILGVAAGGTNLYIADNTFFNIDTEGLALELNAGTTGIVVRNLAFGNVVATSPFTCAGCMVAENYGSGTEGASGIIYPVVE